MKGEVAKKTRLGQVFSHGIEQANRRKSMALLLYTFNLVFALAVLLPAAPLITQGLSHSRYADRLMRGLDLGWISELIHQFPALPQMLTVSLLAGGALYLGVNIFLTGGLLRLLDREEERFSLKSFFAGCGEHFSPLLRAFLFSVPAYLLVAILYGALGRLVSAGFKNSTRAWPLFIANWARLLLALALAAFVNMLFDYVRIRLVSEGERGAFFALRKITRWARRNLRRAATLYLAFLLLAFFLYLVYQLLSHFVPQSTAGTVAMAVLLQQAYLYTRAWTRIAFYGGELAFFRATAPAREEPQAHFVSVAPVEEAPPPALQFPAAEPEEEAEGETGPE